MAQFVSSHGFEYGVKHFINLKSGYLLAIAAEALEKSEDELNELLKLGAIYINNQRQNTNALIPESQTIRVHTKPRRFFCDYIWKDRVVFECEDFVVLDKPSGVPSHPSVDNIIDNSLEHLSRAISHPLFITHRLDTLTEGLIVYGKNINFVKGFNIKIQNRLVEKKYVALVETNQVLPEKVIHYMEPSPRAPKKVSAVATEGWAFCELHILNQKKAIDDTWVKIDLLTGRTHQIRAQLSQLLAPIKGDRLYGAKTKYGSGIALRACELRFTWNQKQQQFNLNEDFNTTTN
ncbi:MAG: RluA family pseudouridine synthase [Bdellovibrio sp.]|nr:RluA family pseudouridine synthase [Bdellovibrio sp.]